MYQEIELICILVTADVVRTRYVAAARYDGSDTGEVVKHEGMVWKEARMNGRATLA